MKMILVRHGETEWNKTGRVQGASDVGLSGTGKEQISRLALVLKEEKLDAIYASPLKRTRETALILGRFHEAEIRLESGLMEMNHGDFEGLFFQELREKHASFLKRWASDPSSVRMPNGETLAELQDRAWKTVTQIVET
jgi:broad specificity phosphatase PhoE